ncbi:penicillin-binding transpeptidase domain-containing protein [Streptomyces radiopugnans]|uniref:NTF2-like N-terminal transpeptidase domain-containing protein n=1 Tax=Streptomyces radiopugnans TaxID=403935 RepID=A0A1H9H258_9ACTN|nr:penicillin-binding transpeptidase domain-containing protein [Streptomyces radiopugnans]SEQ56421.1 NTF2-like N-terminal transpeptidase domain-containing protein [Streptomyces radiopugnans]
MRDGRKVAVIGAVFTAVVGAAGFGAYTLIGDSGAAGGEGRQDVAFSDGRAGEPAVETGPPSPEEVRETAGRFLRAWQEGKADEAAALTDDEAAAAEALTGFRKDVRASGVRLEPGAAAGADVPFTVTAEVEYDKGERPATWTYESELTVVRDDRSGEPVVDWEASVLHPALTDGQKLETAEAGAPPIKALDRNGAELTAEAHPELAAILADLRKRFGDRTDGKPGYETRIVDAAGKEVKTLKRLSKGTPGELRTTLDAKVQKAAVQAIAGKPKASVVALKAGTGEILAVANTPADGFNTAFKGSLAPGSTMKVVTASMLIEKGLASSAKQHPCPKYFTHGGWRFQNLDKFEINGGTFAQSFAASCNTAFISQAGELSDDDLTKQARDVFGIGLNWQVGTATFDGSVPVQSDAQMAASLIGQGGVRANPLIMASVSATVKSGVFRQPYIVSPEVDGRTLAKAPRTLSPAVAQELRSLMRLTATSGSAAEAMAGATGDFGAKTGSAEVDGQKKPNAWFTAYRGDIAAAAVVPASGHGGKNAGPVVRQVLDSVG